MYVGGIYILFWDWIFSVWTQFLSIDVRVIILLGLKFLGALEEEKSVSHNLFTFSGIFG